MTAYPSGSLVLQQELETELLYVRGTVACGAVVRCPYARSVALAKMMVEEVS